MPARGLFSPCNVYFRDMEAARREIRPAVFAWTLSIAAHVVISALGSQIAGGPVGGGGDRTSSSVRSPATPGVDLVSVELIAEKEPPGAEVVRARAYELPEIGGQLVPRLDTGRSGRGGTLTAEHQAINLADRDDGLQLFPAMRSRLERSQLHRTHSDWRRRSPQDSTLRSQPMELTLVSWQPARHDQAPATVGHYRFAVADPASGRGGAVRLPETGPVPAALSSLQPGDERDSAAGSYAPEFPGRGELVSPQPRRTMRLPAAAMVGGRPNGHGALALAGMGRASDTLRRAHAAKTMPQAGRGPKSAPATRRGGARDNMNAEQEVKSNAPSMLHASAAGGRRGVGPGGSAGRGPAGAGGVAGPGSRSRAAGPGGKGYPLINPADLRRRRYLRTVAAKIHPLWKNAFPVWAILQGRSGTVIVSFSINASGGVTSAGISRPSGIPEFDLNCRSAVLRAAPFGPLPAELRPVFRVSMPFVMKNPAVR